MNDADFETTVRDLQARFARMESRLHAPSLDAARRRQRLGLTLGSLVLCVVPALGWAAVELTQFEAGTPIVAADVNANFDALASAVADLDTPLPPGTIVAFGGPMSPVGWLACDGSEVDRSTYAGLFSAIGTTYGGGDDVTTFNLPDLRGRVALGAGEGGGLTVRSMGDVGGAESRALSLAELPPHHHDISDPGHAHNPSDANSFITAGGANNAGIGFGNAFNFTSLTSATTTGITGTQDAGGGQAFSILPPFVALQYIIKA